MMMSSFSPIVRKLAGEVLSKTRRLCVPTDVCLEDWWLSKCDRGKGIAVSGRPVEMRRCDPSKREFHSATARKRYASREFHSAQVVKRLSCRTIETSDGISVDLCGFINETRTQENGFSSEVCRDFLHGFPLNWEDYAAKNLSEESNQSSDKYFSDSALDAYNGAQLHDMVLSLTDTQREILNKNMYDNLMKILNPEIANDIGVQPSKPSPSFIDSDMQSPDPISTKVKNMRSCNTSSRNSKRQVRSFLTFSSPVTKDQEHTPEMILSMDPLTRSKRVRRTASRLQNGKTGETMNVSAKVSVKQGPTEDSKIGANVDALTKAKGKVTRANSGQTYGQREVRRILEHGLTPEGKGLTRSRPRLLKELLD